MSRATSPATRIRALSGCVLLLGLLAWTVPVAPAAVPPVNRYGRSRPLERPPGSIRLATYNVLNLFDHAFDPATVADQERLGMTPTAEARCRKLAEAIVAVDADIVALQEVESLACLKWFRDTFLPKEGYRYMASFDVGYYRDVENCFLSRFPITAAHVWPELELPTSREGVGWDEIPDDQSTLHFPRSPLMVTVQVRPDYELTLCSIHAKSGPDYKWQRESESLALLGLLDEVRRRDPSRNIVLLGDFNAAPWDKSYRLFLEQGWIDVLAHRTMKIKYDEDAPLFKTHESNRVLDYILMNSAAHRELVIGSAHVYGTLTPPDSYDWRTDEHPRGYASDHYPVIVDLVPRDQP